jgi:peptide/nickel transport system permease protein
MGQGGLGERLLYMVLPVMTLSLAAVGSHIRFVRAAMMEALRQDHVRTARAKGLTERQVVYGHALRNAMIPVVTILALDFGTLFSGALITETMFGWLGMGKTIYDAIMGNDYNLALIGLLMATFVVLLANLLADLAYGWLDPRVTYR